MFSLPLRPPSTLRSPSTFTTLHPTQNTHLSLIVTSTQMTAVSLVIALLGCVSSAGKIAQRYIIYPILSYSIHRPIHSHPILSYPILSIYPSYSIQGVLRGVHGAGVGGDRAAGAGRPAHGGGGEHSSSLTASLLRFPMHSPTSHSHTHKHTHTLSLSPSLPLSLSPSLSQQVKRTSSIAKGFAMSASITLSCGLSAMLGDLQVRGEKGERTMCDVLW
jgi:hypothetical protein